MLLLLLPRTSGACEWELIGKGFEDDPRLPDLCREGAVLAREALGQVREKLGLTPGSVPVRWVADVSAAPPPAKVGRPFENGRIEIEDGAVRVILPARKYLRAPGRARSVIRHEATHAALASALGSKAKYERVPRWFREGQALLFADEGEAILRDTMAQAVLAGRNADWFLKGLPPGAAPPDRGGIAEVPYAEAYLAALRLADRLGPEGWKAFSSAVGAGSDFGRVLETFLGVPGDAFRAEAMASARKKVEHLLPRAEEAAFRESLRAEARGRPAEAAAVWESLLAARPRGPLAGTLRYLLAKRLLDSTAVPGAVRRAKGLLRDVVDGEGELWRPEALVFLGRCLELEQQPAAARQCWLEVLEMYGEDAGPAERARQGLARLVVE